MSITIEGKEYEEVRFSEIPPGKEFRVFLPVKQPTFSVGMRVESQRDYLMGMTGELLFTTKMIYRINGEGKNKFYLITNNGGEISFTKDEMLAYFTPYEKPKEGEIIWFVDGYSGYWTGSDANNSLWNLGIIFKTKEQATFARERLSKLF